MKVDYRSFYNLQKELDKLGKEVHYRFRIRDIQIDNVKFFRYLAEQKQFRYLSSKFMGEKRLHDIELNDIEIEYFFLYDKV